MRSPRRKRVDIRMARVKTAGGENWANSVSASAGSAPNISLASPIASWTAWSRPSGSAWSVGSVVKRLETRFVQRSASSPVRMETGTMATSGLSGRASCSSR